jgi:protein phosphatase
MLLSERLRQRSKKLEHIVSHLPIIATLCEVAHHIFCMLTCSYCQLLNPQHHNFCQGCGRSIEQNACSTCVDVAAPSENQVVIATSNPAVASTSTNCPSAQPLAESPLPESIGGATYRWAIIEQTVGPIADNLEHFHAKTQISTRADSSASSLQTDGFVAEQPPQSIIPTTYLDPQHRYKLIDPVVIQLLTPNDSSQVRVIDCQPLCNSRLEILMDTHPVTADSTTASVASTLENLAPATYPQWQFWNDHGIPKVPQAYIALQVSLPGTIPTIHDTWDHDGKTVTVVEDRHDWMLLLDRWNDPEIPSSQVIYWLDYTLRLWIALEPWQMRQSLLEIANLILDEDARICFQRLYPESVDTPLQLADLAQMWKNLFDRSNHPPSPSLASLIESIHTGEIVEVEAVKLQLQQIAYELEPKQLSAPLPSAASADLSSTQDAPTVVLAQKLINLEDAAATHVGRKREHNEDCFGIVSRVISQHNPKGKNVSAQGLYILCDGMGGHAGGEIASSMTVDVLRDYFATRWEDTLPDEQTIREGIVAANEAVFEVNQQNSAHGSGRMGTTLVLVLIQDRDIAIAHVGDSRCYGITPTQGLIQLTLDHEVGQQQILRGVDPDIAYGRPDSYQLTQAIGPRDRNYIAPEIRFFELQEDTLILLASDGLTDNQLLESYWLTNVAPLLAVDSNLQDGVDRLIDFANEYNGHDNITALVVRAKLG